MFSISKLSFQFQKQINVLKEPKRKEYNSIQLFYLFFYLCIIKLPFGIERQNE